VHGTAWEPRGGAVSLIAAGRATSRQMFLQCGALKANRGRNVLEIRQLFRSFREGERVHRVLAGLDAHVGAGETVAIVGRSGSGKSTLLNLISGIDRADGGTVRVDEVEVTALAEPARTLFRRAHIGFVYQLFNLIPTLNVAENVRLVLELNGVPGAPARERSLALLEAVGLRARAASAVDTLSGGEQQRVAIARALVHRPKLLLADEPTGNLDAESAAEVLPLLLSLTRSRGAALVMVTHDEALAASADRVLELREGRLQPRRGPQAAASA
jgi:putative ABC transport system ATP-binding protein